MDKKTIFIVLVLLVFLFLPIVQAMFILNPSTDGVILSDIVVAENGTQILNPICSISSWFANSTSFRDNARMSSNINSALINYTFPSQLPSNIYGRFNCTHTDQKGAESFMILYTGVSSASTGGGGGAGGSFAGSPIDYNFILEIENQTNVEIITEPDSINKIPMTIRNIGAFSSYVILDCGVISGTSTCEDILTFEQGDIRVDSRETRIVNLIIEPKNLNSGDIINLKIIGIEAFTHVTKELNLKISIKRTFSGIFTESITGKYIVGPQGKELSFYKGIITLGIPLILGVAISIIKIKKKRQWYMTLIGIGVAIISMLGIGILVQ